MAIHIEISLPTPNITHEFDHTGIWSVRQPLVDGKHRETEIGEYGISRMLPFHVILVGGKIHSRYSSIAIKLHVNIACRSQLAFTGTKHKTRLLVALIQPKFHLRTILAIEYQFRTGADIKEIPYVVFPLSAHQIPIRCKSYSRRRSRVGYCIITLEAVLYPQKINIS